MLLELAAARRILFIGGKGGVGKTTVTAALALREARRGRRVLLVSTDPAHNLGHIWETRIGDKIVPLLPNLDAIELDPQQTTLVHLKNVASVLRTLMPERLWGEIDKHMALSRDAPGMHEAALLERIAELVTQGLATYDLILFDTAPSGHTARLMALPEMMSAWTEGLLRRQEKSESYDTALANMGSGKSPQIIARDEQIRQILRRRQTLFSGLRSALQDSQTTAFVIVLAAERLPVLETIEFREQLRRTGVDVAGLVINKRSRPDAGELLAERHAQEEQHLATLRQALPDVPAIEIPLLAGDVVGEQALAEFAIY